MKLGFQPVNISATFYGNAVYPAGTSSWSMRLQIANGKFGETIDADTGTRLWGSIVVRSNDAVAGIVEWVIDFSASPHSRHSRTASFSCRRK
ncbi:MAG: hypothetical protein ABSG11_21585 [Candidatus Korobacteraceae bacterium]|jgi:hypothetical protein